MKIIDDKGRLFGKVNLLDLFVIIFVVAIIAIIISKFTSNPESYSKSSDDNVKDMHVLIKAQGVPEGFYDSLQVGDKLLAQNAYTGGEIYNIVSVSPAEYTGVDDKGQVVISEHPYLKDVVVELVTKQNIDSPVLKVNGQEVRTGLKIFFKTQKVESPATVLSITFEEPTDEPSNTTNSVESK